MSTYVASNLGTLQCSVRKTPLFAMPFIYKTNILPRQARDKHRENSKKEVRFSQGGGTIAKTVSSRRWDRLSAGPSLLRSVWSKAKRRWTSCFERLAAAQRSSVRMGLLRRAAGRDWGVGEACRGCSTNTAFTTLADPCSRRQHPLTAATCLVRLSVCPYHDRISFSVIVLPLDTSVVRSIHMSASRSCRRCVFITAKDPTHAQDSRKKHIMHVVSLDDATSPSCARSLQWDHVWEVCGISKARRV